jgi:hypothetical protein
MIYTKTITEAKNGNASSPTQRKMPLTSGLIYQVEFYFPPGSSGLLFVCVKDGGFQIWPSEPGEYFFGDNTLISFKDMYYVSAPSHNLDIYSYNLDDRYDHIFQVRIGQVNDPVFISSMLPSIATGNMEESIAAIIASQDMSYEAARARVIEQADEAEAES